MSEAPSCFWNAFTRPPASRTMAASAWALRFFAEAKVPSMILFASASEIARIQLSPGLRACGKIADPTRRSTSTSLKSMGRGRSAGRAAMIATTRRRPRREGFMCRFAEVFVALGMLALGVASASCADEPTVLRVNAFPQAKTLPLHAGIAKGIFERRGLKIALHLTENSRSQRDGLAAGTFDVVHSAVDNALAMVEIGKHDVVIVTGGDSGMNEFFVQAEVKSFADMRDRTLVVDAPDTAYALQAKKILAQHGLKAGTDYTVKPVGAGVFRFKAMVESNDNAAAILNLPFTVQSEALGMKSL